MKKDTIYIDVEDDITAIIGKIKAAKEDIVALVPPRRLGVLQSVVNLKLLKKAAGTANKRIVLITGDQALSALTAGLGIPVAKDLQSRPEIIPANESLKNESEVIEGEVRGPKKDDGENPQPPSKKTDAASKAAGITPADDVIGDRKPASKQPLADKSKGKGGKGLKVPNFDMFKKYAVFVVLGLAIVIGFFVWAIAYAPHATITIYATSDPKGVNLPVALNGAPTNAASKQIQAVVRQDQTTLTKTITPTGTKLTGNSATGTIAITNCEYPQGLTISSGQVFEDAKTGLTFTSTATVVVPAFTSPTPICIATGSGAGTATVNVQASGIGTQYNIGADSYTMPNVAPSQYFSMTGSAMQGGTSQEITVVSQSDFNNAVSALEGQSTSGVETQLAGEFDSNTWVLKNSFFTKYGTPTSSPAVNAQATGNATITIPVTYYMIGMSNSDINAVLTAYMNTLITNQNEQGIISNGFNKLSVNVATKPSNENPTSASLVFTTTGYIGPHININQLKTTLQGDKFGQVQATVTALPGVKSVQVHYSPFWVTEVPKPSKTTIKLQVANE